MSARCYIVTGATYPFRPSLWTSKRAAMRKAASMRRWIREEYVYVVAGPRSLGIAVEARNLRDVQGFELQAQVTGEYLPIRSKS